MMISKWPDAAWQIYPFMTNKAQNCDYDWHLSPQAAVHVSTVLSKGKFDELRSVMSKEVSLLNYWFGKHLKSCKAYTFFFFVCFCLQAVDSLRKKCKTLSEAQKRHLAISLSDIIFLLPEDVSVFFDQSGESVREQHKT